MTIEEILTPDPCPFCGAIPITGPAEPEKQGDAWGFVACQNDACPAQPIVQDGEDIADMRGSAEYIAAAVRRWNSRILPADPSIPRT